MPKRQINIPRNPLIVEIDDAPGVGLDERVVLFQSDAVERFEVDTGEKDPNGNAIMRMNEKRVRAGLQMRLHLPGAAPALDGAIADLLDADDAAELERLLDSAREALLGKLGTG